MLIVVVLFIALANLKQLIYYKFLFLEIVGIVRLLTWHIKFEKCKVLKKDKNEEIILVAWHPRRLQNFCMSQNEKKRNNAFSVHQ